MQFKIYRSISFLTFFLLSINSFSSTGIGWFDDDLDECYEAIEKGSFLEKVRAWSKFDNPYFKHAIRCRIDGFNYLYDEKLYSLNRVIPHKDSHYNCKKLVKSSYGFCEYAKFKKVKGARPSY